MSPLCAVSMLLHLFFFQVKALAKTLDPASAVQNALLACKEWVALRADIYPKVGLDAASGKGVATGTRDRCLNKFGVNSSLHKRETILSALLMRQGFSEMSRPSW